MIDAADICFTYNAKQILQKLTFHVFPGEIVAIIGTSGSGKTTLLKLLAGLLNPDSGEITIAGQPESARMKYMSYMMQEDLLLPWRTVLDNITLAAELGVKGISRKLLQTHALQLLHEVGMDGCEKMSPDQLSGGMRQRVALARALMQNRPLLFLDEPFGSLDVSLREQLYCLLRDIQRRRYLTLLVVTHDFRDALSLADRILLLANGSFVQEWAVTSEVRNNPFAATALLEQLREGIRGGKKIDPNPSVYHSFPSLFSK
jgi:NitT/TauT family transport system ATP-binding protein